MSPRKATGKPAGRPRKTAAPKAETPELTPEQKKIAELEAKLEALLAAKTAPVETSADTQVREEFVKADNALRQALPESKAQTAEEDTITIHWLQDGASMGVSGLPDGYKGQEVTFVVGSREYKETFDRDGNSWLHFTVEQQHKKWGKQIFGYGKWYGKDWRDRDDIGWGGPTQQEYPDAPVRTPSAF